MSVRTRYTHGQLYELIDNAGGPRGLCLFLEIIEPEMLTLRETVRPNHWHIKVLHQGSVMYYDTSFWTLIEIYNDAVSGKFVNANKDS